MAKSKDKILNELEELFGAGVVVTAKDKSFTEVKNYVSTPSLTLNIALAGKGVPKDGRCTAIVGKESSGKTTLAQHIIAEEHRTNGGLCAFLDVEESIDLNYMEATGVQLEKLHLIDREKLLKSLGVKDRNAVALEEWLELLCKMLESNIYDIIILDSLAALQPMSEIQQGLSGGRMGSIAGPLSKAYRAISNSLAASKTGFVYLNQYRANPTGYGNPWVEPGGEAWRYLQSVKLEITKSLDKDTDGAYGIQVKGKITKSKICRPFKEFSYYIEFGKGIVPEYEVLELAVEKELIKKGGAGWYTLEKFLPEPLKIQGDENVVNYLMENKDYCEILKTNILDEFKTVPELIKEDNG